MVPFALLLKIAFQGSTGFGTPSGIDTDPGASRNAVTEGPSDPGIFDDRILFGQSATFSGLARELGIDEMLGIQAAFGELNQAGGVHGRQLNLTTLYDYYEPNSAYANTKILIYHAGGFTLIGEVGTPISRSASPLAGAEGIPFIAPFTGAKFLRDASLKNSVNLRASYYQETEEMVARLTEDLGFTRVAFFPRTIRTGRQDWKAPSRPLNCADCPRGAQVLPANTSAVKRLRELSWRPLLPITRTCWRCALGTPDGPGAGFETPRSVGQVSTNRFCDSCVRILCQEGRSR